MSVRTLLVLSLLATCAFAQEADHGLDLSMFPVKPDLREVSPPGFGDSQAYAWVRSCGSVLLADGVVSALLSHSASLRQFSTRSAPREVYRAYKQTSFFSDDLVRQSDFHFDRSNGGGHPRARNACRTADFYLLEDVGRDSQIDVLIFRGPSDAESQVFVFGRKLTH